MIDNIKFLVIVFIDKFEFIEEMDVYFVISLNGVLEFF